MTDRVSTRHFIESFQHLLGTRAHGDVVCQVDPANHTTGINQKFSRASNVGSLRSGAGMQQVVTANDFRLWIGKERVREMQFLPLAAIDFRRINAQRDHTNAARFQLRKLVLKTPQLGVA